MTDTATGRRGQKHAFSLPRRWLVGGLATLAAVAFIGLPAEAARAQAGIAQKIADHFASVKTMSGEMWSDFPFTTLPAAEVVRSERGGKTVIRSQSAKLRIAQGGPLLTLETLNGDIFIRSVER